VEAHRAFGARAMRVCRRLKTAHVKPRTNYMLPHELGHPVAGVNCFHAAKKLHKHYEAVTEARKEKGKEVF